MSRGLHTTRASGTGAGAASAVHTFRDTGDLERIVLTLDTAPTTAGSVTITLANTTKGAAYDATLITWDPVAGSSTVMRWEDMGRFENGDVVTVSYANPDARDWSIQMFVDVSAED